MYAKLKTISNILSLRSRLLASILVMLISITVASAQGTYVIQDVNFKNKLQSSYPWVMTGNQLNITAAGMFTNDLILTGANISNLDGIQYFTSVFKIDASFNNLTALPNISSLTQLKYLYVNFNRLTQLPDLSNQTNLVEIQATTNALTSLPSLTNLVNLNNLFLTNNKLTSLPNISTLVNLKYLIIGNNPFTSLPDFSPNVQLLELHVHQTNISQITGLAQLTKLTKLYCWENSITDLSALSDNTTLTGLFAFSNKLRSLPTLTNKPNLNSVEVEKNNLTFEDLLPLKTVTTLTDFSYSPQDSLGTYTQNTIRSQQPLSLSITEDAGVSSNTYTWYKNAALSGITTRAFSINKTQVTDKGKYYVSIKNPNLPLLTLTHRIWNIEVTDCIDLNAFSFDVSSNECSGGATVETAVVLNGGTAPYTYALIPFYNTDTIRSSTGDFTQVPPGKYTFTVRDANNCGIDSVQTIPKPKACDPVITPNGDAHMNSYFIEQSGPAKIVDMGGKTILQLTAPAVWYGTKADGTLADAGYYVIIVNNKKITNITVVR
ncbi:Leucine-rich repeat (LRR) protein [Cytophaga hutchinsonii ATCC 33406]|nr:Leucine-rich repeat (LRR) protein [Cytophaga hutchinsonii ATCC 33406]